jgi:ubiquinone/menaquinone biosynthesis C-methylase UbiE
MSSKQNISAERELFDSSMDNFEPFDWAAKELLYSWLEREGRISPSSSILDLAAGSGNFTKILLHHGHRVIGFDLAFNLIKTLRNRFGLRQVFVGRAEQLALADGSFDVVTMCGVLHHFPDMLPLLSEVSRVLKPGGVLFAIEPNLHNPWMFLFRSSASPFYISEGVTRNERPLRRKEVESELSRIFPVFSVKGICGVTLLKSGTFLDLFLSGFNAYSRVMGKLLPQSRYGEFLICTGQK